MHGFLKKARLLGHDAGRPITTRIQVLEEAELHERERHQTIVTIHCSLTLV